MTLVAVDCHMVAQTAAGDAGNGRYATGLVEALAATAAADDRLAALVAVPAAHDILRPHAELVGVPAADVPRLARAAPKALSRVGADAAVFTYIAPAWNPCPVLLAVHDATFLTNPEWLPRRARPLLRHLVPRSARRARLVLVLSHTARDHVGTALKLAPEQLRVVSPHVGAAFTPGDREAAARSVADRFGLRRYCLAVGDLNPRKNLAALGDAIRRLGDDDLELALVGRPGPTGERIAQDAGGRWLGHVDDATLIDLYRAAEVTAYPSLYEGFGLPALEAMACGCPVVASNRGALPEVVGNGALLVEPDAEAIAEGLRAALEPGTQQRLRQAGPLRAARYTRNDMGAAGWAAIHQAAR